MACTQMPTFLHGTRRPTLAGQAQSQSSERTRAGWIQHGGTESPEDLKGRNCRELVAHAQVRSRLRFLLSSVLKKRSPIADGSDLLKDHHALDPRPLCFPPKYAHDAFTGH